MAFLLPAGQLDCWNLSMRLLCRRAQDAAQVAVQATALGGRHQCQAGCCGLNPGPPSFWGRPAQGAQEAGRQPPLDCSLPHALGRSCMSWACALQSLVPDALVTSLHVMLRLLVSSDLMQVDLERALGRLRNAAAEPSSGLPTWALDIAQKRHAPCCS